MTGPEDRPTRSVLDGHLTDDALRVEAAYFDEWPGFERPYGWCWALMLAAELQLWDDPVAASLRPST